MIKDTHTIQMICQAARFLDDPFDFKALDDAIGEANIVMLGEATHGTHEFYHLRAEISKHLIREHGFDAIAVEADWPDALRVSRYIQLASNDKTADEALSGFQRFPQWMWRNTEIVDLVYWLRLHNTQVAKPESRVGFF